MFSPIIGLAGLTLEINHFEWALTFDQSLFSLLLVSKNEQRGSVTLQAGSHQTLTLWKPTTQQQMTA